LVSIYPVTSAVELRENGLLDHRAEKLLGDLMKKTTIILLIILILTLTACAASAGTDPASAPENGISTGALPATTRLILGTLKLEGTDQEVTAEQANELLPLWQTQQVLSDSDTAADEEKEALITQIRETMTAEQMQAITEMNLTREDMFAVMQEQGMAMGGQDSNSQSGNSSNSGGAGFAPGGGLPGGPPDERGFPGGGPGFGGGQGQNLRPDQIATAQAARQAGSGDFIPPMLINALIEYLQEKAGN